MLCCLRGWANQAFRAVSEGPAKVAVRVPRNYSDSKLTSWSLCRTPQCKNKKQTADWNSIFRMQSQTSAFAVSGLFLTTIAAEFLAVPVSFLPLPSGRECRGREWVFPGAEQRSRWRLWYLGFFFFFSGVPSPTGVILSNANPADRWWCLFAAPAPLPVFRVPLH